MSDDMEGGLPSVEPAAEANGLDNIINSAIADTGYGDEPKVEQAADDTGDRQRDERGRFASKAEDAPEGDQPVEPVTEQPEVQPVEMQPLEAPARWTEADKAKFAMMPREAQELVSERYKAMEADYTRKSQEVAEFRRHAEPLVEAVQPYSDYLTSLGQQIGKAPASLVRDLLGAEYTLRTGTPDQKQQALAKIAADYGIPVTPQGEGQADPYINHLYQRIPQLESRLSQYEQMAAQEEQRRISQTVESFQTERDANGQPAHPHFEDVKPMMAALMQSGQATTLKEAYDLATAPIMRLVGSQQANRQAADEKTRLENLEKARKAAPVRSSGTTPKGTTTAKGLDAILSGTLDKAGVA